MCSHLPVHKVVIILEKCAHLTYLRFRPDEGELEIKKKKKNIFTNKLGFSSFCVEFVMHYTFIVGGCIQLLSVRPFSK